MSWLNMYRVIVFPYRAMRRREVSLRINKFVDIIHLNR